jgi:glycosyltransferase involved in cell wall biosynthesis
MKIAILTFSYFPEIGGYQVFIYHLIKHLLISGYCVDLYVPYKIYKKNKLSFVDKSFKIKPILIFEGKLSQYCPALLTFILKFYQKIEKYELWQVVGAYPAGYIASSLAKEVPVFLRTHGEDIQKNKKLGYGLRLSDKKEQKIAVALKKVTHLIALTQSVVECYKEFNIDDNKITVIPNAVEQERFNVKVDFGIIRKNLNISKNELFILSTGRYHLKKGFENIPEAAAVLKSKGVKFKWLLIGKNIKIHLESLLIKHNVKNEIIFLDEISFDSVNHKRGSLKIPALQLIKLYKSADIYVMPSLMETFGMVLIEAMAAELCIVTCNSPGCKDVVTHMKEGLLAKPNDPKSLAENILKIINNKDLMDRLIANAKQKSACYDWNVVIKQYTDLYKSINLSNSR